MNNPLKTSVRLALLSLTLGLLSACSGPSTPTIDPNTPVEITTTDGAVLSLQGNALTLTSGDQTRVLWVSGSTWTSDDPSILSVQISASSTTVTALQSGTTTLRGTYKGTASAQLRVTVRASSISAVSVTPSTATLNAGGKQLLTAKVTGKGSFDPSVIWTTSNSAVATVSASGTVTALSAGTATIKATSAQDNTKSASALITVNASAPTSSVSAVSVTPTSATLNVGVTQTLTATVSGSGSYSTGVTWTSSNTAVATVNSLGVVTAISAGSATIKATSTQDSTKSASAGITVNAPAGSDPFNITIVFPANDGLSATQRQAFQTAAARWEKVIAAGLPDVAGVSVGGTTMTVDDVAIEASGIAIDGTGNVLGQAGPRYVRQSGLPLSGLMQFDSADLANMEANGTLVSVIMHEMGHVLGIGTLWSKNIVHDGGTGGCTNATQVKYTGTSGLTEYKNLGGQVAWVPVEDQYGSGTKCGHWKESVFRSELMTGFASSGAMPLSRITVGALADLGYTVNYAAADAFTLPSVTAQGVTDAHEIGENILMPNPVPFPGAQ